MKPLRAGVLIALLLSIAFVAAGASVTTASRATGMRGPFMLVQLPSLGTVTWTCKPASGQFALGYRASPRFATTAIEHLVDGRRVASIMVDPGDRVRFAFSDARRQVLRFVQGTGAGVLRASVRATFEPTFSYCFSYLPPPTTITVSGRR
jgi:hypothetical protein